MNYSVTYPDLSEFPNERTYTHPRPWCVNPEFWHAADPDSTEFEVLELVAGFARALQPTIVVETGSAFGYGSHAIGTALKANGHGKLYSLEIEHERVKIASNRVRDLPVEVIKESSLKWHPPSGIGLAFFDSFTDIRAAEYLHFRPFMVEGAIAIFHDAAPHHHMWDGLVQLQNGGVIQGLMRIRNPRGLAIGQVV